MRTPAWIRQHLAALRALLVLTVLTGVLYPLLVTGIAQLPGLRDRANGSIGDHGSALLGQNFTDDKGAALVRYFQSRPSAAGKGYDPTATSASNLGPESVVDTLGDPARANDPEGDGSKQSLLTQVCARSKAAGELEGVDGSRPFCTAGGVGAVLAVFGTHTGDGHLTRVVSLNETGPVFLDTYQGVRVEAAKFGEDYSTGDVVPVRGTAPATPAVPADAVTASGSGLDPDISPAYAALQIPRIARVRGITEAQVKELIAAHTTGRALGFMGEPTVRVLELNLDLDRKYPAKG